MDIFLGFVLLDEVKWDREQLVRDLRNDWDMDISGEISSGEDSHALITAIGDVRLVFSLMDAPVPNGKAEYYARGNYMWKEAIEVTGRHKAHIMIAATSKGNALECANCYVKAAASCLKQKHAIALYSEGAVYQPKFFIEMAQTIKKGVFPIFNTIWFGFYRDKEKIGFYTYGMKKFDKEEIEVYVSYAGNTELNDIREFIADVCSYVIENDVTLKGGDTIGFSKDQKLPITYSDGIALDGKTLKIRY